MAIPKVFVSSTCYDLIQIRDSLFEFIKSYYYEPILSEKGDVFFHPDLHTHESCLNELENCQLFILIIGGRFGGSYKFDTSKSITNAEYEAAKIKKIPIFTFIQREVYEDHRVYQKNKHNKALIKKINFPSIEKQEYAVKIFEFIDKVRLSDFNNSYYAFEFVNQIKDHLGKQWAGLMYDFLSNRSKSNDQQIVNQTLDNLTLINRKTEELVENIYKQLKPQEAVAEIEIADKVMGGAKFYSRVFRLYEIKKFKSSIEVVSKIDPKKFTWYDYLRETKEFEIVQNSKDGLDMSTDYPNVISWLKITDEARYWDAQIKNGQYESEIKDVVNLYEILKTLNVSERKKALQITTSNNL
ncbi:DUF4062 domain-containing protein [Cytophaga aurantiaca]|uniref:DUF4062 domain-containing protein n=1 Tax=Cytophaga aurantiaca TaxID=29530 RepID=UPI000373C567|nr:DUF4062 domain-containing protein [Cytophaga aurantiaca]